MGAGSGVISTLTQALNCSGKCDCCQKLQQEINDINGRLDGIEGKFIPRSEKPQIIDQSVRQAYGLIMPEANGYADNQVNLLRIFLLGLIYAIASQIEIVKGLVQKLFDFFEFIKNQVAELTNKINQILSLPPRVESLERELPKVASIANQANTKAETALANSQQALEIGILARTTAREAKSLAQKALEEINALTQNTLSALQRLEGLIKSQVARLDGRIDGLVNTINQISSRIGELINRILRIEGLIEGIQAAINTINSILGNVEKAIVNLYGLVFQALQEISGLIVDIGAVERTANEALSKANEALRKAAIPGRNGINGINGRDGITTVIQVPGIPGRDGIDGKDGITRIITLPGVNGRDGIDGKDAVMDAESKALLRQAAQHAALIPALAARPAPLDFTNTTAAAAAGTCQTMQPGGCGDTAIKRNNPNLFNGFNNIFNTGSNAVQDALLLKIDAKLGEQIAGGISGKLVDGFKWLQLDRVLNILIFASTVHNAAMLSGDILQTLIGALTNVLTLIVPKDDAGQPFNIGEAINSTVENVVKGIVGEANYTNLTAGWAKANRIYQASTNVLNTFMNLTQTLLQASEMIAAYTGKIGNALKKGGVVLENAYGWMNPQPKFNRVSTFLEGLQEGASTVQLITQVPLDIVNATTELTTSATDFVKAVKEDGKTDADSKPVNKATPIPEPDELKAKETAAKTASQPISFDFFDLFDGED